MHKIAVSSIIMIALSAMLSALIIGAPAIQAGKDPGEQDPEKQAKQFNKCTEKASRDGELTEEEYFSCAYSIYG
jgi:hypothetical protein